MAQADDTDVTAALPPHRYTATFADHIETKWQQRWEHDATFVVANPAGRDSPHADPAEPYFVLDMFPYPSADTLHVGHPLGYLATDVIGRYQRMAGKRVLHTMGYDAFGLPAEQYAVQTGRHPRDTTTENIAKMRSQLRRLGAAYDDTRVVSTTDESFYRWTQWMFARMFDAYYDEAVARARPISQLRDEYERGIRRPPSADDRWQAMDEPSRRRIIDSHRLAYIDSAPVNWCPGLGTVLADEEVTLEGRSERGNFPVFKREFKQWKIRITAYAERLLADLETVDWPEPIKAMQRNWIGKAVDENGKTTYHLRDWLFSRQRYWGEPFPIVFDADGLPYLVPDDLLPVRLPDVSDFSPAIFEPEDAESEPVPPLANQQDWVEVELDLGDGMRPYRREVNTMPQWAGSSWYFLRYLDPHNDESFCAPEVERYWIGPRTEDQNDTGGVDLYVGGVEHAVLHLLYARYWHKVLWDLGYVSSREPFRRLLNQGYVLAWAYSDDRGTAVPSTEVLDDGVTAPTWQGRPVSRRYGKMGKSLKNSITPEGFCAEYSADTLRLYEMSMAPLAASRTWDTTAVAGPWRFLERLWRQIIDTETGYCRVIDSQTDDITARLLHRTIAAVRDDYEAMSLNTILARLTELINHIARAGTPMTRGTAETIVLMVAPLAPHIAEELWERLGQAETLAYVAFPSADTAWLYEPTATCVVQVNGKMRDKFEVPADIDEAELVAAVLQRPRLGQIAAGDQVIRTVVRAPRMVNFVTAGDSRGE